MLLGQRKQFDDGQRQQTTTSACFPPFSSLLCHRTVSFYGLSSTFFAPFHDYANISLNAVFCRASPFQEKEKQFLQLVLCSQYRNSRKFFVDRFYSPATIVWVVPKTLRSPLRDPELCRCRQGWWRACALGSLF